MTEDERINTEAEFINQVKNMLLDWIAMHKKNCASAECCEPENAMAFLLHFVGIRAEKVGALAARVSEYEASCPACKHLRN